MARKSLRGLTKKEWEYKYRKGQKVDGRLICGAYTKSTGEPCKGTPLDNGRCWYHSGMKKDDKRFFAPDRNVPGRPPTIGKYSKYLKFRLADKYEEFINDKDITSLRDELAQTRALLVNIVEKIDIGEKLEKEDIYLYATIVEQVRRLSEAHVKIETTHKYTMSPEEIKRLMTAVATIIFKYIDDEGVRAKIAKEITEIKIL